MFWCFVDGEGAVVGCVVVWMGSIVWMENEDVGKGKGNRRLYMFVLLGRDPPVPSFWSTLQALWPGRMDKTPMSQTLPNLLRGVTRCSKGLTFNVTARSVWLGRSSRVQPAA